MQKEKRKHSDERRPNPLLAIGRFVWMLISGTAKGIWWVIANIAKGTWHGIKQIAIWGGRGIEYTLIGAWWLIQQPFRLMHYLINGPVPEFESKREQEVFWRTKRPFRRRKLFLMHSVVFISWLFIGTMILMDSYQSWQRALGGSSIRPETYERWFYQDVRSVVIATAIGLVLLLAHFIFNKMSDQEDQAVGNALDREYVRAEQTYHIMPDTARLEDQPYADYYEEYDDLKPKRNGARAKTALNTRV